MFVWENSIPLEMLHPSTFHVYNASAGSGKTYTLVKEYLKILFNSQSLYVFQNILAITFTNKAAAEMKERVLENLRVFSHAQENDMLRDICQETGKNVDELQAKSKKILQKILQNYGAFQITTIDSFTHKLIRTFALDLELPLNFELELDGKQLLKEAVDLLISRIGVDEKLTEILVDFALRKANEDRSWDISKELYKISEILLKEKDLAALQKLEDKSLEEYKKLTDDLRSRCKEIAKKFEEKAAQGLSLIAQAGIQHSDFSYRALPKYFQKLSDFEVHKIGELSFGERLQTQLSKGVFYTAKAEQSTKEAMDAVSEELITLCGEIKDLIDGQYGNYVLMDMVAKNAIPVAVLSRIEKELSLLKKQNNLCLNAEFNALISKKIKNEPAPYIYERIGEKFRHYFVDEMQDTSFLQWQNLIPLMENSLAQEKGSLLLVGDAKQAIYRWRGGEATQFIDLTLQEQTPESNPFQVVKKRLNLETNYRSHRRIIEFNNSFFSHIAQFLKNPSYRELYQEGNQQKYNERSGGFVQLQFCDRSALENEKKEEVYPKQVWEVLENLDKHFQKNEVCILVRTKKQGVSVANYLSERGVALISSETLLLKNSRKVQFLINLLYFIQNPLNREAKFGVLSFLHSTLNTEEAAHVFYRDLISLEPEAFYRRLHAYGLYFDYEAFFQMAFYDSIEELLRSFGLMKKSDAYLQFFLDVVLDFQRKHHSDLTAFLEHWEQKKEQLSIATAESTDAVRIMTVHKAKGLEFPVVIFPCDLEVTSEIEPKVWFEDLEPKLFNHFPIFRVPCTSKIKHTGDQGNRLFEERQQALTLDNFNLLYVALTRAVEQLYIITDFQDTDQREEKTQRYSGMYIHYLKSLNGRNAWSSQKKTYAFGTRQRVLSDEQTLPTFSGEQVVVQESLVSSRWQNHKIQLLSKAAVHWGTRREDAIQQGLLVHEMLSEIYSTKDVTKVVEGYVLEGRLSRSEGDKMSKTLLEVANHPDLNRYFTGDKIIFTEREILTQDQRVLIPDRLIFDGKDVVLIDYKTGGHSSTHERQIEGYAGALEEMGFAVKEKLLVYLEVPIRILKVA